MTERPRSKTKSDYHHGDLRRALLKASLALIEVHGIDALSLREVAKYAGVSPGAPYHHFKSKRELLVTLAAEGFDALSHEMSIAHAKAPPDDPIAQLRVLGMVYIAFAQANPTAFRLMFRRGLVKFEDIPPRSDCDDTADSFTLLVSTIETVSKRLPKHIDARALVCAAWSLVHGAAELVVDGPLAEDHNMLGLPVSHVGPSAVDTLTQLLRTAETESGKRTGRKRKP